MGNPITPRYISTTMEKVFFPASFAIINMDIVANVISWNLGAEKKFGWKSEEAIGRLNPALPFDSVDTF